MFDKNPFNEYRATQQQVQERTAADCEGMVCKKCGDTYGNPTEGSCMYDSKNPNGKNWMEAKATNEATQYVIPEDIPQQERTAFHGAAAAAAKAGKSHFSFAGKKHPVTMKKDTANAIADDNMKEAKQTHMFDNEKDARAKAKEIGGKYVKGIGKSAGKHAAVAEGYYKDLEIKKQDKEMGAKPVTVKKKKQAAGGAKEGDVTMNPKMDSKKKATEQKESRIRTALKSVLVEKENHSPNKEKAEKIKDARKGKAAEDMMADADAEIAKGPDAHLNEPEIDKKNFQNMTKNVPSATGNKVASKANKGDKKIVPSGTQFKDPNAMKPETAPAPFKAESYDKTAGIRAAYASMYEKKVEEVKEEEEISELSKDLLHKASDKAAAQAGAAGRKGNEVGASKKTDQSRKFAKGATKAGDRDAEKDYQASKGK